MGTCVPGVHREFSGFEPETFSCENVLQSVEFYLCAAVQSQAFDFDWLKLMSVSGNRLSTFICLPYG